MSLQLFQHDFTRHLVHHAPADQRTLLFDTLFLWAEERQNASSQQMGCIPS